MEKRFAICSVQHKRTDLIEPWANRAKRSRTSRTGRKPKTPRKHELCRAATSISWGAVISAFQSSCKRQNLAKKLNT